MRKLIGIFALLFLLAIASCKSRPVDRLSMVRSIQGYTYDRVSGERLKGAVVLNRADFHTLITDTVGKFTLSAHIGDSIRFTYIGMKDTVLVLSNNTPSYLEIGLDTANTTLIDPDIVLLKHISETEFKPFQFDNGDDYVKCDRYRIVDKDGRIGYANGNGYVIIEPRYAFGYPYEKGMAKVTDKGVWREVEGSKGEYHYWDSDEWYYINLAGDSLSSVESSNAGIHSPDSIEFVYFNNEWIQGANINMVDPESITKIEIKNDEYANRAAFISITSTALESLKKQIEKANEGIWIEYPSPYCEFPGGNSKIKEWVEENIRIPSGFKGKVRVIVSIRVQPDGRVTDGKILKGSENEEVN